MTKKFGATVNTNDTAVSGLFVLNDISAITILPAQDLDAEQPRIRVRVDNPSSQDVWIRLMPAITDPTFKGTIKVIKKLSEEILEAPNVYTGEISAIADVDGPTIYVTSY